MTSRSLRALLHLATSRGAIVAVLCAVAAPLAAQVKLEVTPQFASYYATNYLTYESDSDLERQEAGPGIGAALTWRFTNIWALEGQATYVKSGVVVKCTGCINFEPPTDGSLLMVNARVLFQPRRTNLFFALGAGTARRGGEAFDVPGIDDKVDVAGIVGVGIRTRVTPEWGFRLGVEMHVYTTDPDEGNAYYQKRQQRDVLVTIGVPFALIGR